MPPPVPDSAQVRAAPGKQYEAGRLHRLLLGTGWRDLWTRPIELPVLDIDTFAGGLTPLREGGNAQSVTLHFVDASGRRWIFRSVDKYPGQRLADGLDGTLAGYVIQDQISSLHPSGALVIPPLLDALGILHVHPAARAMPDDPRLGEFRDRFAGMIGLIEEKPDDDVPDGVRRFAGSAQILDTEDLLDRLEEVPFQLLAQRELLRARLFDFVIGDTDRTADNYDWAGFPDGSGNRTVWRPIPRDRDWAFIRADGLTATLISRSAMPKLTRFEREHSPLAAHTPTGHALDRRLLSELDRADFDREVAFVRASLSDSLIDAAVHNLPRDYPEAHRQLIAGAMKARRNELSPMAAEFYEWLASDVDIHASDAVEHVEIHRDSDGTTEVTITAGPVAVASTTDDSRDAGVPVPGSLYHRVFRPAETHEIRIFLHGGDDFATVRGSGNGITIRVIGGGGDDVLADSSSAPGVFLYDGRGDDTVITGPHTNTVADQRGALSGTAAGDGWNRDWGSDAGVGLSVDHTETVGFVVGAGPTWTEYGFRHAPYRWRMKAFALTNADLSPGARLYGDYRFEASRASVELDLRWSSFDAFRWFGSGNRSELVSDDSSIVRLDRVTVSSAFVWRFGEWHHEADRPKSILESDPVEIPLQGSIAVGPTVRRTKPDVNPHNSFAEDAGSGSGPILQLGVVLSAELRRTDRVSVPRRGFRVHASVEGFSGALSRRGPSGSAAAEVNGYIPLPGDGPHLAVRAGSSRAFGAWPPFDAARVGGRSSLRGFSSGRFAGDAAAFAGTELRVPVVDLPWIAPGELGVFGLLDAGRVWVDHESPGGWHTARGIGLWVLAFRQAASVAYVTGEQPRLYVWLGMPY